MLREELSFMDEEFKAQKVKEELLRRERAWKHDHAFRVISSLVHPQGSIWCLGEDPKKVVSKGWYPGGTDSLDLTIEVILKNFSEEQRLEELNVALRNTNYVDNMVGLYHAHAYPDHFFPIKPGAKKLSRLNEVLAPFRVLGVNNTIGHGHRTAAYGRIDGYGWRTEKAEVQWYSNGSMRRPGIIRWKNLSLDL